MVVWGVPTAASVGLMQSFAGGMMLAISFAELLGPAMAIVGMKSTPFSFPRSLGEEDQAYSPLLSVPVGMSRSPSLPRPALFW